MQMLVMRKILEIREVGGAFVCSSENLASFVRDRKHKRIGDISTLETENLAVWGEEANIEEVRLRDGRERGAGPCSCAMCHPPRQKSRDITCEKAAMQLYMLSMCSSL